MDMLLDQAERYGSLFISKHEQKEDEVEVCSKERPFVFGVPGRWEHPDAIEIDVEYNSFRCGPYSVFRCPHCGLQFREKMTEKNE